MKFSKIEKFIKKDIQNIFNCFDKSNKKNSIKRKLIILSDTFKTDIEFNIKNKAKDTHINLWTEAEKELEIHNLLKKYGKPAYLAAILLYLKSKFDIVNFLNSSNVSYSCHTNLIKADVHVIDYLENYISSGCDLDPNTVYINSNGQVIYNINSNIKSFEFKVNEATINDLENDSCDDESDIELSSKHSCTIDLSNNDLSGNDLSGNDLSGNDLSGNDLSGNDLSGKDLSGKDLSGNDLSGNDLSGNDLSGNEINNISQTDIDISEYAVIIDGIVKVELPDNKIINKKCGNLIKLTLTEKPSNLSNIVFKDENSNMINVSYFNNQIHNTESSKSIFIYKLDCNNCIRKSAWNIEYDTIVSQDIQKEFIDACKSQWVKDALSTLM